MLVARIVALSLLIWLATKVVGEQKRVLCLQSLTETSFAKSTPLLLEVSKRRFKKGRRASKLPKSISFLNCHNPYRLRIMANEVSLETTKISQFSEYSRSKESRTPKAQKIINLPRE